MTTFWHALVVFGGLAAFLSWGFYFGPRWSWHSPASKYFERSALSFMLGLAMLLICFSAFLVIWAAWTIAQSPW